MAGKGLFTKHDNSATKGGGAARTLRIVKALADRVARTIRMAVGENLMIKLKAKTGIIPEAESLHQLLNLHTVEREQILPLLENNPGVMASNAVATLLVAMMFLSGPAQHFAMFWALASLLIILISLSLARRIGQSLHDSELPAQPALMFVTMVGIRGLVWAIGLARLIPEADLETQMLMGWLTIGLMSSGAFAYWPLPLAGVLFSGAIALGGLFGLTGVGLSATVVASLALMVFAYLLLRVMLWHVRVFRNEIISQKAMAAKNEVISLLLKDFEESASDWLWETDRDGVLTRGAQPFAQFFRLDASRFHDSVLPLVLLGLARSPGQRRAMLKLGARLRKGKPFAGCMLAAGEGEHTLHLEISAKPIVGPGGDIEGWRGVASNRTAAAHAEAKVKRLALFDPLTELPNRVQFTQRLAAALGEGPEANYWVMFLDLDGFKGVNDSMGHAAGDQLLKAVVERLRPMIGADNMLARFGGDEFGVLTRGTAAEVEWQWRRLVQALHTVFMIEGRDVMVGVSIGIMAMDDARMTVDEVLRRADLALYRAKHDGRGSGRYYEPVMDAKLQQRRQFEQDLRKALTLGQFQLHYQPMVDMKSRRICGMETLLRWHHPERGLVPPDQFIPVAEQTGLINEIGEWVLSTACMDAARWPAAVRVAVNMSPMQLRSHRLLASVTRALAASGLAPSRLELEVTESALVEETDRVAKMLDDLRALGVIIALDDFGTGYSSLSYLHQFHFDKLKIDKSFVQSFEARPESRAVVRAALLLARELGFSTTAEGVETEEQFRALAEQGCEEAQGYLLGRPAPLAALAPLLVPTADQQQLIA
jgi:diguanylate cyclase (GGDEF)-like protein